MPNDPRFAEAKELFRAHGRASVTLLRAERMYEEREADGGCRRKACAKGWGGWAWVVARKRASSEYCDEV